MQIVKSGYPMERIAIDIIGTLPQAEKVNKYIVVVPDYFTKWNEALPMPNMEAFTVANLLVESYSVGLEYLKLFTQIKPSI